MLVIGEQDPIKLKGKSLSSKEQKALDLIEKGHPIKLLLEDDFFKLIDSL
ncbi:DNA polymerase III subunit epsilon [Rodentibacter pneumotropicus]|uniref:DNA polymerase III subunit epsilon n=1 Tax=Rodentibacter pneumotropicus TaxID=758 RepID=A0A3S5ES20_9PAST|nr:DNA polymerase III subunit epsilon [Rodentibacter pneumotropicus]